MRLPVDDPGRASERTALAWTRSGALLATVGVFALTAAAYRSLLVPGAITAVVLGGCGCLVAARGRRRYGHRRRAERYAGDPAGALLVVAATLLASVLAGLSLLIGP